MSVGESNTNSSAQDLQRRLKAIHFKAVTAYNKLKDEVHSVASHPQAAGKIKELGQEFRLALEQCDDEQAKESLQTQKIVRDFQGVLQRSESAMKEYGDRRARQDAYQSHTRDGSSNQLELQDMQRQQQVQSATKDTVQEEQLLHNEIVIEERSVAIQEISGQIGEVHQIFQDLAVLVHDQGEAVDDIESNIVRAAQKTQDAHVQVRRAERSQRKAARNKCFLMMLGAGAVTVLFIILLA